MKLRLWQILLIIPFYFGLAFWRYTEFAAFGRGEMAELRVYSLEIPLYSAFGAFGVALTWALPAFALIYVLYQFYKARKAGLA